MKYYLFAIPPYNSELQCANQCEVFLKILNILGEFQLVRFHPNIAINCRKLHFERDGRSRFSSYCSLGKNGLQNVRMGGGYIGNFIDTVLDPTAIAFLPDLPGSDSPPKGIDLAKMSCG